jgi:hypothetical protein
MFLVEANFSECPNLYEQDNHGGSRIGYKSTCLFYIINDSARVMVIMGVEKTSNQNESTTLHYVKAVPRCILKKQMYPYHLY